MINPTFQIKKVTEKGNFGEFVFEPLEPGFGQTLGNSLRRVLLTSLPGAAITQVKTTGVKHKFSTLDGLKEDMVELHLNLKQVRVRYAGEKPVKAKVEKSGPGPITAGDIEAPSQVEIINKDLVLGNLADKKSKLKMEIVIEKGWGYLPSEERKSEKLGTLSLDASFSPVRRVNYRVEAARVGQKADLDRLIIGVTTDGTIKPNEAIKKAAAILVDFFSQVVSPKKVTAKKQVLSSVPSEALKLTVEELDLPTRIANALRKGGYGVAADLAAAKASDLAKVKNLGEKSVLIIKEALEKKGLLPKGTPKE